MSAAVEIIARQILKENNQVYPASFTHGVTVNQISKPTESRRSVRPKSDRSYSFIILPDKNGLFIDCVTNLGSVTVANYELKISLVCNNNSLDIKKSHPLLVIPCLLLLRLYGKLRCDPWLHGS